MTSNHHAPYDLGYTRATMDGSEGSEAARRSETQKPVLSSDCTLQLECMKMESLVIANQNVAVNTFSGLVHTARHTTRVEIDDWGEVVTRYPYGNVGMDHLLSKEKASVEILFSFEWTLLREAQEEIIENWIIEKRKREDRDKEISRSF